MNRINLNLPLAELQDHLSVRTLNALVANGMQTLKDVCRLSVTKVAGFKNLGYKSMTELSEFFESRGLTFSMSEKEITIYQRFYENSDLSPTAEQTEYEKRWEQRRYELVRDLLIQNKHTVNKSNAISVVETADLIIKALKGEI